MKNQQRLNLLMPEEIEFLYGLPLFSDVERRHYFSLPEHILLQLKISDFNYNRTSSKLYFILQYGYFKAKNLFFNFQYKNVIDDVTFIMQSYLPNDKFPKKLPCNKQQIKIKRTILDIFEFKKESKETYKLISNEVSKLAKSIQDPTDICFSIIALLKEKKIVLPGYARLQDLIGAGLQKEENRLISLTSKYLTKKISKAIDQLFEIDDAFYRITKLKTDPKCFRKKEMEIELEKLETCKQIYLFSKKFLPKTNLSRKNIEYYANLARFYTVNSLKRLPEKLAYFYLICYVNQRCEHIINNLIKGFGYYVDKYIDKGKKHAKDNLETEVIEFNKHKKPLGNLISLYVDNKTMKLPGEKIQKKAFKIMSKENIIKIRDNLLEPAVIRKDLERKLIWEYHKDDFRRIFTNLRPLFLAIDFGGNDELKHLLNAMSFLEKHLTKFDGKDLHTLTIDNCPTKHIRPKKLLNNFIETGALDSKKINLYQYEFHIYKMIRENLKKQQIFVNDSIDYKNFNIDIKKKNNWDKDKNKILKNLNNKILLSPIDDAFDYLENILEPLIIRVNNNIASGKNKHIKIKTNKDGSVKWTLPYPKKDEGIDNPFYDNLEPTNISEIYDFVVQQCNFIKGFKHLKPKFAKSKLDYIAVKATLLANGTTQGTFQFSKRSNVDYQRLRTAEKNYFRLETLRNVAAILIDGLINLPIFDLHDLNGKKHASLDGVKKKTTRRTLKSRHSAKHFGLDVGVVIMTMTLNQIPFVTNVVGANEHESHFSYSMLFNNITAIDPDIISTDTAGTNNVNDFMFFLIGKMHAACYRSIADKAKNIYGFKPLSEYDGLIIKPTKTPKKNLVRKKWPELLPIFVALLSHETNQSTIIRKLSSHDYKSEVKEALWELNNILKSIHILKYIDDPNYRQNIRAALNRGEDGHKMVHKIMSVGSGNFRGMSDLEVEIWNECTRIIILIILYYNAHILSKLYENNKKDLKAVEFLKHISFAATQHINIGGIYSFSDTMSDVDIDQIVKKLDKILSNVLNTKK